MKIKMTKTKQGSNNGISVSTYKKGCEYDIGEDLASVFVKDLCCAEYVEEVEIKQTKEKTEIKMEDKKAENKMENKAPENKGFLSRDK